MWTCLLFLVILQIANQPTDAGYCSLAQSCTKTCSTRSKHYTACGLFNWERCSKYKTRYYSCANTCYRRGCCSGYTGPYCDSPVCFGSTSCPNNGICMSPDSCQCIAGFSEPDCADIDECKSTAHGCEHECVNTLGSYKCACQTGFMLDSDLRSCFDVNECLNDPAPCDTHCINTVGSYYCTCDEGYIIDENNTCQDKNECLFENPPCSQGCQNNPGSYQCICDTGFSLDNFDGTTCLDIDECLEGTATCDTHCLNTEGSYNCSCNEGYIIDDYNACQDIDECKEENAFCNQMCVNEPGSYRCECDSGYRLSSSFGCVDIDECAEGISGCTDGCTNEGGTFQCSCQSGFILSENNKTCEEIDDCIGVVCKHGGTCIDGLNMFTCSCASGYSGTLCETDIDECSILNGGCQDDCTNTNGSYMCSCFDDRILQDDGVSCKGGADDDKTVFEKYSILLQLLPKPCYDVLLTRCSDGKDIEIRLASTTEWYSLLSDQNVFYTFGIVFVNVTSTLVPIALQGIEISMTANSFELRHSVRFTSNDGKLKVSNLTMPDCEAFVPTSSDLFDFTKADSFSKTQFRSLFQQLPSWIQFEKSNHSTIAVEDMKSDLIYGRDIDNVVECSGAPVLNNHLYSVFRFNAGFSLEIFGDEIRFPPLLQSRKFCIIADLCQNTGGTVFLMIPEESRDLLLELEMFQTLKNDSDVNIRLRGIGLSLTGGIDVGYDKDSMTLWNGDHMFQYPVIQYADFWVGGHIGYKARDVEFRANGDLYFNIPSIETMLTSLFLDEWNGLYHLDHLMIVFHFTLFGTEFEIMIPLPMIDFEAYFSVGGTNRKWCGEDVNPPGLFFSLLIDMNPFSNIPILKDLYTNEHRIYVFISKGQRELSLDVEYIRNEIVNVRSIVNSTISILETSLAELESEGNNMSSLVSESLEESIHAFQEVADTILKLQDLDVNSILSSVEQLGHVISDVKSKLKSYIGKVELIANESIKALVELIKSAVEQIQTNVTETLTYIIDALLNRITDRTDFGMMYTSDISLFGLSFRNVDVEFVESESNLFQCTRFEKIAEFLNGEAGWRILIRIRDGLQLGPFLSIKGGFAIAGALSKDILKAIFQVEVFASMLGTRHTADLFITSKPGLYFYLERNVWDTFLAQIEVSAELDMDWFQLTYVLEGRFVANARQEQQIQTRSDTFTDSYLDALLKATQMKSEEAQNRLSAVQNSLTLAQEGFTKAQKWLSQKQSDIRKANDAFDKAISSLEAAKQTLEDAKDPFDDAIRRLKDAQKDVDNLCKIRNCPRICIPGIRCKTCHKKVWWGRISLPCCWFVGCMISFPEPFCLVANAICRVIRAAAYAVLEITVALVRTTMIAFDIAQAAVTVSQTVVDTSRVALKVAEGILDIAQAGLEYAKVILEAAKNALEAVKFIIGAAAKLLDLVIEYGVSSLLDVKNCQFRVELSTKDIAVFDISCDVNAFRLGWQTISFTINFRNVLQSIWQAARTAITELLSTLGNVSERKRRHFEFEASSKIHRLLRFVRQTDAFETLNLNETIDIRHEANICNMSDDCAAEDRIMTYKEKCETVTKFQNFLKTAFLALQDVITDSKSYLENINLVKGELSQYNASETITNITTDDVGINKENAAEEYNMTYEFINNVTEDTKLAFEDDPIFMKIKSASNTSLHYIELESQAIESVDFVNNWYTAMDNMTKDYFEETECNDFRDCMFYAISSFYELYEAEEFPNVSAVRDSILSLEGIIIESFQNESTSISDTAIAMDNVIHGVNQIIDLNPFCSTAPVIKDHPVNVTALIGTNATFNCSADGNPEPSYWWYIDDIVIQGEGATTLMVINILETDNGRKINCVAGNIVANITSSYAFLQTADSDVDECETGVVNCEYDCLNTIGSYTCICPDGFSINEKDERSCLDIDECQENVGHERCEHICTNYIGGFSCSCNTGYELSSNGHSCNDINECATENGECDFQCVNLDGSSKCICDVGYVGNGTVGECTDENECETDNGDCEQTCTNTDGAYKCECSMGYELANDGHTCNDIDECDEDNAGCEHRCVNTEGGYNCTCSSGYYTEDDLHQCSDIDECEVDNGGCQHHCSNNAGSFECNCTTGFELIDGLQCVDIDECISEIDTCGHNCENTVGSFSCFCEDGFILDEDELGCLDIDECLTGNGGCDQLCMNTNGSFACACASGFGLDIDKLKCHDIDECSNNNGQCEQLCLNEKGSFQCACNEGYLLESDKTQCTDVNECADDNGGCSHVCENTPGSYQCLCEIGSSWNADNGVCEDIDECSIYNGGCHQECVNTIGSFLCSCKDNFVLDRSRFVCLAPSKKSFQASITIDYVFVLGTRTKRSETLTVGTVKQPLEEFYHKFTSNNVTIVVQSMKTTINNTEIDYTVVYDVSDSTNLVRATLALSSGTNLTFNTIAAASRSYLPANITNECHVFETYMEGCDQGQRCEISPDGPTCLDDAEATSTPDYLVYILPAVGAFGLCVAVMFVTIFVLRIRKLRQKKKNRYSPIHENERVTNQTLEFRTRKIYNPDMEGNSYKEFKN